MVNNVFYSEANNAVIGLVSEEFPNFRQSLLIKFISYINKLCHYEEEGLKVRPTLFFTDNIALIVKTVPEATKIPMFVDADDTNFNSRMKALLYFCQNDWCVYINFNEDTTIEYGLVKSINSIKEKNIKSLIFENYKETLSSKLNFICVEVISSNYVTMQGIHGNNTSLSFSLNDHEGYNWEGVIKRFVEASVSKLKTTNRKLNEIKTLYENIFQNAFKNIHGAICLVVDKEFKDTKNILSDGIWLREPIELSKLFVQSKSYSEAKLRSYAELFVDMLNYDGVTIVDNAGRIRAYNVFVEINVRSTKKVIGGARKRAAMSLLNSKNKKFVGVYFQSQDGDNFYEEVKK